MSSVNVFQICNSEDLLKSKLFEIIMVLAEFHILCILSFSCTAADEKSLANEMEIVVPSKLLDELRVSDPNNVKDKENILKIIYYHYQVFIIFLPM
jgi:hypothetical protein